MRLSSVLPPEAVSNVPRIVLTGQEQLLIEGHKGLILCDHDRICIRLSRGRIDICGINLIIVSLGPDDIHISGTINKLELTT